MKNRERNGPCDTPPHPLTHSQDFRRHFVSISVAMAHVPQPPSACDATGVPKHKNSTPRPWGPTLVQRAKTVLTPQPTQHAPSAPAAVPPATAALPTAVAPPAPPPLRPAHMFSLEVKPSREAKVAVTLGVHQVDERCVPSI